MAHPRVPTSLQDIDNMPKLFLTSRDKGYELQYTNPAKITEGFVKHISGSYRTARKTARDLACERNAWLVDATKEAIKRKEAESSPEVRKLIKAIGNLSDAQVRKILSMGR
jgi:hypothetical protein